MVLTMSRAWEHPKTGVYRFRKVVPERLRALVGKREEKQSFNTRDAAEAKRLHTQVAARVDERWANLEEGPVIFTGWKRTNSLPWFSTGGLGGAETIPAR